jgi:aminoglycoside phosphotransferase (APT) family kinase protein
VTSDNRGTGGRLDGVIAGPEEATPARLTEVLLAGGVLGAGVVEAVRHEPAVEGGYSLLWPLRLRYSPAAAAGRVPLPTALLLKMPRPDIDVEQTASNGRRECFFYTVIAPAAPDVPVPRCFSAALTENGARWHLLLEDLSATHHDAAGWVPPPEPLCLDAIALLGRLHARWWRDPALGRFQPEIGRLLDEERMARVTATVRTAIPAFLTFLGGRVPDRRRRAYEHLAAAFPVLLRRLAAGPVTLLHGDAHWRNFLYPRDRAAATTQLFDWQSCTVGPPAHDLGYLLARFWHPAPERDLMDRLLDAYYAALVGGGVPDYGREQLRTDVQFGALRHAVAAPTNWFRWGRHRNPPPDPAEWATRLERFLVPLDAMQWEEPLAALGRTDS